MRRAVLLHHQRRKIIKFTKVRLKSSRALNRAPAHAKSIGCYLPSIWVPFEMQACENLAHNVLEPASFNRSKCKFFRVTRI